MSAAGDDDEPRPRHTRRQRVRLLALERVAVADQHERRNLHLLEPIDSPISVAFAIRSSSSTPYRSLR